MTRVEIHPLSVGSCSHCERVTMAGGSWRSVTFPSFSFLILHPVEGPILYDTGYASHFADATRGFPECAYRWLTPVRQSPEEQLSARLAGHGLRLRDVRWCLISHFHAYHIAGLRDLSEARFLCMRDDWQGIRSGTRLSRLRKGLLTSLLPEDFDARTRFAEAAPSSALAGAWAAFDAAANASADAWQRKLRALAALAARRSGKPDPYLAKKNSDDDEDYRKYLKRDYKCLFCAGSMRGDAPAAAAAEVA